MVSNKIKIPQGVFVRSLIMMRLRLSRVWRWVAILTGLVTLSLIVAGMVYDIRMLILALMVMLIVIPMVISLIYINDGFSPANFYNTLPHTIKVKGDKIEVTVYLKPKQEYEEKPEDKPDTVGEREEEIERRVELSGYEIGPYYTTSRNVLIPLKKRGSDGIMILPSGAFDTIENLKTFIHQLYDNTSRKA